MLRELEKLTVEDWDRIGYVLYVVYLIIALLSNVAFFMFLLYFGAVALLTWRICRSER